MKKEIEACAQQAIAERVFPGCVIGIIRKRGKALERIIIPVGTMIYHSEIPVAENTVYDLASITKSIPLASLALTFIQEGKLRLEDQVTTYIPELHNDFGVTIEDLLRYRVHGPRLSTLADKTPDGLLSYVFEKGFDGAPADSHYANLPALLVGLIIERVGNDTLENLAKRYFFDPLKMKDTSFFPKNSNTPILRYSAKSVYNASGIAPTEIVDGKEIRGIVHDESARVFAKAGRAVGHAGLFSTAPDLLNFLEALLKPNAHEGPASHNHEVYVGDTISHIVAAAQRGLGWEVGRQWMGKYAGERTFGKTGFTGTSILCDIQKQIGLVILSNRTYPHRPADSSAIHSFRADIADGTSTYGSPE